MRAFVMEGPGKGIIKEVPDPTPGGYEATIEMIVCGVCSSTDKMLRMGTFPMGVTYPSILGHESVGRVIAIGDRVRNFQIGDLVTRPSAYRPDVAPMDQYWGGFATRGVVTDWTAAEEDHAVRSGRPRHDQVRLDGDTEPVDASLAISLSETFSVAARHDLIGTTVVVVGTGIAGLGLVRHARLLGAQHVVCVGRRQERLRLAQKLGADVAVFGHDAGKAVQGLGGADYIFEASGQSQMVARAYPWLKSGGQEIVYSAPDTDMQLNLFTTPRDASLTVASTNEAAVLPGMVQMIAGGVYDTDSFVTQQYPFDHITQAFTDIDAGGVVKAVITFP